MPERSGKLHEISAEIGELKGLLKSVEKYVHQYRHDGNNLSQKMDALGSRITRDIAAVEARMEVRFDAFDKRLRLVEANDLKAETQKGTVSAILQSPIIGGIVGSVLTWAALFLAWWKGQGR